MVEIGVVGKPNVGKSTFFTAVTMSSAEIANYPFTTIDANRGVGYVRKPCPHTELGKACAPKKSLCLEGTRYIPVELIDVAGLVPGAYEGRGLGNKFLDDLRHADALIHIIDISGATDAEGNPVGSGNYDPLNDIKFLDDEIARWIAGIISNGWVRLARKIEGEKKKVWEVLAERLSGLNIKEREIKEAMHVLGLDPRPTKWGEDDILAFSRKVRELAKPMVIAGNKADAIPYDEVRRVVSRGAEQGYNIVPISADYELALRRAAKAGLVEYRPGDVEFKVLKPGALTKNQMMALDRIAEFMRENGGTGVQRVLEHAVFELLDMIAVYPVEDENKWTDKNGNVLPDVFLMPRGSTALELAYKVHTDLGENFIRAVDGRSKRILGHDYELKDGDVIKIIARV
ncbi:MAG: redox-regulated ATPase YchF [Euryarchaeota archaeon]|nr:redox-regulated ATPase YchF [Euryarchaeota archaeon]